MSERVPVDSVVTDLRPTEAGVRVVGEVTTPAASDPSSAPSSVTEVFSDGSHSVYRFDAEGRGCPCRRIPRHGCPIRNLRSESGALLLRFVVPDIGTVRSIVSDLRSHCESVEVRQLIRSESGEREELLVVNRSAFTDRQYEALRTAHEMGYFARPRGSNASEVADDLGVSVSTFGEHLSAAQSKLMDQIFRHGEQESRDDGK